MRGGRWRWQRGLVRPTLRVLSGSWPPPTETAQMKSAALLRYTSMQSMQPAESICEGDAAIHLSKHSINSFEICTFSRSQRHGLLSGGRGRGLALALSTHFGQGLGLLFTRVRGASELQVAASRPDSARSRTDRSRVGLPIVPAKKVGIHVWDLLSSLCKSTEANSEDGVPARTARWNHVMRLNSSARERLLCSLRPQILRTRGN